MTGLPDSNIPAFDITADLLRERNYVVENPADNKVDPSLALSERWQHYMRLGLTQLVRCHGVALLEGWERSRGATLEHFIATQLGLVIMPVADWCKATPRSTS